VSFTLPLWNRNRGVIAVELATREQLRTEYASRLFAARRDITSLVSAIELERLQAAEINAQATSLVTLARASEEAANRGDLTTTTAQEVRHNLRDKQRTCGHSSGNQRAKRCARDRRWR
jgi:cobalt-zinc-cadmium efflux system outer membrane protein